MIDYYLNKGTQIHIKINSGKFFNGYVVEKENDSVVIFKDRVLGLIHLFISQIDEIEEYREEFR